MGLYNFQPRFVPKILSGEKTHTIRSVRAYPDKPGNILHLYTGLRRRGPIIQKLASGDVVRQKMARLLMRVPCVRVEEIEIKDGIFFDENHASVCVEGVKLDRNEREQLARRDGFGSFEEMIQFWRGRLPFKGHIIHWSLPRKVRRSA
jgi:hypothetical protein